MFAKLFDTELGQVVVLKQSNDEGNPEIRFFCEPEGLGVCSMAMEYNEDDWDAADEGFDKVNAEMALAAAQQFLTFTQT